ncbi:MAG: hypothetical protein Q8M66_06395, partial [Actinomycetota bacterium]|nr:hypothetical protein [Actinomycetota bacterium]
MSYEDIKSWIDLIFTRNGRKAITGDHGNQLGTKLLDYAKEFRDLKGVADGLAELASDGKVKPDQLRDPDLSGCVKTNQDPKQTLSDSPIFNNLTPGRVVFVG